MHFSLKVSTTTGNFLYCWGGSFPCPPPRGEKEGFTSFKSEGEEDAVKKVDPQEVDPLPTDPRWQDQRWLLQPEPRPRTPTPPRGERESHGLSQVWRVENRGWWWVAGWCVQVERLAKPLKDFIISKKWGGMVVEECHQ